MRNLYQVRYFLAAVAVAFFAASAQLAYSQIPEITSGPIPEVSVKTAPKFNRKIDKQLDNAVTLEKEETTLRKALASVSRQSGVEIDVENRIFFDVNMLDAEKTKIKFPNRLMGISTATALRLICEQTEAIAWKADNKIYLIPRGRFLNKLIEETILVHQPVDPELLEMYFSEIKEQRREKNRSARMVEFLATPVDVEELNKPLKEVLEIFRKKYHINIVVDLTDLADGAADPLTKVIQLSEMKSVRLDRLLQIVLGKTRLLGYRVFADHVTVYPRQSEWVHVAFDDVVLHKAIDELIEQTGATISIKVPEASRRKPVTLTALDESLETILQLLAHQADAEFVRMNGSLLVVTREEAVRLRAKAKE